MVISELLKSCISKEKIEAACYSTALSLGYSTLKDEQKEIIISFVAGNDVFGILPTGYGKSLCYVYLVYPAYLINFLILQILLLPQPTQYVAIFNSMTNIKNYIPGVQMRDAR